MEENKMVAANENSGVEVFSEKTNITNKMLNKNFSALKILQEQESIPFSSFRQIKLKDGAFIINANDPDEDQETKKEIYAILLGQVNKRVFWSQPMGSQDKPDCVSNDGIHGRRNDNEFFEHELPEEMLIKGKKFEMTQNEDGTYKCKTCPFAQFGSKDNGGQMCQSRASLLVYLVEKDKDDKWKLVDPSLIPAILDVAPTSLKHIRKYMSKLLINHGVASSEAITKLTSVKEKNKSGISYDEMKFAFEDEIDIDTKKLSPFINYMEDFLHNLSPVETLDEE